MDANSSNVASRSFRRGAIALSTAAALLGSSAAAHAGSFSHEDCRLISSVITDVAKTVGARRLSLEFRQSLMSFIAPEGKLTCDGPKDIITARLALTTSQHSTR